MRSHFAKPISALPLIFSLSAGAGAQVRSQSLPNAPQELKSLPIASAQLTPSISQSPETTGDSATLTRQQAEKIALGNNPHIHISQLIAKVQHQAVRERRADELPNLTGNVTAVEANDGRLSTFLTEGPI